jgi:hypothetical protein
MTPGYLSMAAVALCVATGAVAYRDLGTSPAVARASLFATESSVSGHGGPFPGAQVQVGSYCRPGKRDKMQARLYWATAGDKVGSVVLWLEAADGSARQVASEALDTPRHSGVAAGSEYQVHGPWVRARLELFAGAADYAADKTTIEIDCDP